MATVHHMAAILDQRDSDDKVAHLRVPPHSKEAEESVLGGLLIDNSAFAVACDLVGAEDFHRYEHRLIFAAISDLITDGQPADTITVFERLQANGKVDDVGGLSYLNALSQCVPGASNMRRYAQIVREKSILRRLIAASDEMATAALNPQGWSVGDLLEAGMSKVRALANDAPGRNALPILDYDQLREHAQAVTWLVKGVVQGDAVGVLFGASGTFKSYIALDMAMHVVHGLKWLGRRTHQGPVIVIAAEGGTGIYGRLEAWHRARRLRPPGPDMLRVIPVAVDLWKDAWRVVEAAQMADITPALVVVDTLAQTFSGEENIAQEMGGYLRELGARFRSLWRCTVVVIHHSGHSATDRPRGSSAIQGNTSFLLGCFRDEKERLATLTSVHMKEGALFEDAMFELRQQDLGTDADGDTVTQLVARHLSSSEEVQEAMAAEHKAGRGGHNRLIVALAQNGIKESDLRKAFYEDCEVPDADARRQAYFRARKWAIAKGFFEIAEGFVIVTQRSAKP